MDDISQRILRKIGIPDFFEKIGPLNTADFNSVLLKLFSLPHLLACLRGKLEVPPTPPSSLATIILLIDQEPIVY